MSNPHVLIFREEDIPPQIVDDFTAILSRLEIPFETEQTKVRICNAVEQYIPTALVVLLVKPFFEAFLKKAGEDAYTVFKRGLAALAAKAALVKEQIGSSSSNNISETSEFSRVISVYSHTSTGVRIKFLVPAKATEDEYIQMIDSMLMLLSYNYAGSPGDALSTILARSNSGSLKVFRYDLASSSWHLLEPSYNSNAPRA